MGLVYLMEGPGFRREKIYYLRAAKSLIFTVLSLRDFTGFISQEIMRTDNVALKLVLAIFRLINKIIEDCPILAQKCHGLWVSGTSIAWHMGAQ